MASGWMLAPWLLLVLKLQRRGFGARPFARIQKFVTSHTGRVGLVPIHAFKMCFRALALDSPRARSCYHVPHSTSFHITQRHQSAPRAPITSHGLSYTLLCAELVYATLLWSTIASVHRVGKFLKYSTGAETFFKIFFKLLHENF